MEKIIPFRKTDYTEDGVHISSDKFIMELQTEWEEAFHNLFNPYFLIKTKNYQKIFWC